jgi:hypothetical protein
MLKDQFLQARRSKHKIRLTFYADAEHQVHDRICAPLDYGPGKADRSDHFHVWVYESTSREHLLSLTPEQVRRIDILDEEFDPADFVWFINRDWGQKL